MLRPLNYPPGVPARGRHLHDESWPTHVVMNIIGQVMIEPRLDDPFHAVDRELELCRIGETAMPR